MVSWRTRQSAITFDLGAAGIRACQFWQRGGLPRLADTLQLDLLPTPVDDEPPAPTLDAALLARLVGQGRFAGADVALVVSAPEVQFYPLRLPEKALTQPAERLQQALKWEVAQESRGNADELEVRYWRLPRGRGQDANVMAVALPVETAVGWCDTLQAQGLAVRRIDVAPCALVRSALQTWTPADTDLWGILDLGLRHSTLTVVVGTTPAYIRTLTVCAHHWTRQLAHAFEVDYAAAERIKREVVGTTDARGATTHDPAATTVAVAELAAATTSILRDSLRSLAQQVGRCFSYIMQGFPDQAVNRLLLAGGGAALRALPETLAADLGISVALLVPSPASSAAAAPTDSLNGALAPRTAAACGGAMLDLEAS